MDLKEFSQRLREKQTQVVESDIPVDVISTWLWEESFSKEDNFITAQIDGKDYTIEFNAYASWSVKNSGGDHYITPNYNYADDIDIEIDITNIEDYDNDVQIPLDDTETIGSIERWVSYQLDAL